jgi:hypothetical protein
VPTSVLEAIKRGDWSYDPENANITDFDSTEAMPGSREKIAVLARRLEKGLPLWHPRDRRTYKDTDNDL